MRKVFLMIIGLMMIAGCSACSKGPQVTGTPTHDYDAVLTSFNEDLIRLGYPPVDFSETTIRDVKDLKDDNGEKLSAYCYQIAVMHKGIINIGVNLDTKFNPKDVQKAILYHELGHCVFGLKHVDGHAIMNGGNLRLLFTYAEITDDNKRLKLFKEMVESSAYGF